MCLVGALRDDEHLRSGLFHPGQQPLELAGGVPLASADDGAQLGVTGPGGRLPDERPG